MPQIEVTFDIDANGIVNVSAKDLGTGKENKITITAGTNMSEEEIEKAVKEAKEFEAQDKKRKEGVDARNDADSMVFQVENSLKELGDKITEDEKKSVEKELEELKKIVESVNIENITDEDIKKLKDGKENLMKAAQPVYEKLYAQAQQEAQQAQQSQPQQPQGDDDIVDGDFKEV